MYAATLVVLSVFAIATFLGDAALWGWIFVAVAVFLTSLRIFVAVALRKARLRVESEPPAPISLETLEKRLTSRVVPYVWTFVAVSLVAFVLAFFVTSELQQVAWTVAGAMLLPAAAMLIAWRIGPSRRARSS
jgi:Na+/melibiose symporter-like transporter